MAIPPPLNTIEAILASLNGENKGQWVELEGYYGVTVPELPTQAGEEIVDFLKGGSGIVHKIFLNVDTAETRAYIAKFLDIPETDRAKLFPK